MTQTGRGRVGGEGLGGGATIDPAPFTFTVYMCVLWKELNLLRCHYREFFLFKRQRGGGGVLPV